MGSERNRHIFLLGLWIAVLGLNLVILAGWNLMGKRGKEGDRGGGVGGWCWDSQWVVSLGLGASPLPSSQWLPPLRQGAEG